MLLVWYILPLSLVAVLAALRCLIGFKCFRIGLASSPTVLVGSPRIGHMKDRLHEIAHIGICISFGVATLTWYCGPEM